MTSSKRKRRILGLAAVFIVIIIAGYQFRGTLHYKWLTSVATPLADTSLSAASDDVEFYEARIVKRIPHNPNSFVQGLQLIDDTFYEGTGLRGESALMRHHFDRQAGTLNTVWRKELPAHEFGEGVTVSDGVIYQLTWEEGQVHRYRDHYTSPTELTGFSNDREGWGLTTDGEVLIASDGSETLFFRSPENFSVIRTLEVHHRGKPVVRLNELEFINGQIWANLWMSQYVVSVNPSSGTVTAIVDCAALITDAKTTHPDIDYLNGIAWDEANQHLYLTGKLWPWIYQVALDAKPCTEKTCDLLPVDFTRAGGILTSDGNMIRGGASSINEFKFNPRREIVDKGVKNMLKVALDALSFVAEQDQHESRNST